MMSILKKHSTLLKILRLLSDLTAIFIVSYSLLQFFHERDLIKIFAIYSSILIIFVFPHFDLYQSWRSLSFAKQIQSLFFAWVVVLLVLNLIILLLSNKEQFAVLWPYFLFKIPFFYVWSAVSFIALLAIRVLTRLFLNHIRRKGLNQRRCVIVGAGEAGKKLARFIVENPWMGIQLVGFFSDRFTNGDVVFDDTGTLGTVIDPVSACFEYALQTNVDIVFVTLAPSKQEKITQLIWQLGTSGVQIYWLPDFFTFGIHRAKSYQLTEELVFMDFRLFPEWKRIFDVSFSLFVIFATFPVWLFIVILIKLEDGGPVFYRHKRIMENGRKFDCIKFRTMFVDADKKLEKLLAENPELKKEWDQNYKLKNDPRITQVGKFLRRTSLDELPQFINVLKGEMSVVGARPIVAEELEKYYSAVALTYCATKPGITGLWQAGERSDTTDYNSRVELDKTYILNCSIWLDLKIILKTTWRIFRPKGAY